MKKIRAVATRTELRVRRQVRHIAICHIVFDVDVVIIALKSLIESNIKAPFCTQHSQPYTRIYAIPNIIK